MKDLSYQEFANINFSDTFFDSLREDYAEFSDWCKKKSDAGESAYVFYQNGVRGFLYLKLEVGAITDVAPQLPNGRHLKIGTFKFAGHGTKLGQRFVKKIFDHAVSQKARDVYVTVFGKHRTLIDILLKYGFYVHGKKASPNGVELVLRKDLRSRTGDILKDYPRILKEAKTVGLLAIYPEYHTQFLPDSKLNNESIDIVEDVSHTNSIHKIYISGIAATGRLERGDILLLYRTTDRPGQAYYRSVATSIGVVEEAKRVGTFASESEFIRYVRPYSVFSPHELKEIYATKKRRIAIKFTYNVALPKRLTRKVLLEEVGLPGDRRRWDYLRLTPNQFSRIVALGQVNEDYFID